jgi:predicted ATPase
MIPGIRHIEIQNFKSIERAVVDLAPLTVLVGPNGAGKSNFVETLTFLQQLVSTGVEQTFQYSLDIIPQWVRWGLDGGMDREHLLGLRLELDLPDGLRAEYAIEIRLDRSERATVSRERCRVEGTSRPAAVFEVSEGRFVHEIAGIRAQLGPDRLALFAASATEEFRPVYDFLNSIRVYSISPTEINRLHRQADSGLSLDRTGTNAASVLKTIIERSPEDHARIARLLGQAVEGITSIGVSEGSNNWLHLEFHKDIGLESPGWFLGSSMSDGTLRLLGLLLAVYQPNRPSVLVVEEPEATVHPAVAQLVTEILLDAAHDRQVLVTTHSPDILDAKELSDDQIRVVTQRQGRTIVSKLSKASRQAIRDRLYTPGELLRINELDEDADQAVAAAEKLDLFPPLS